MLFLYCFTRLQMLIQQFRLLDFHLITKNLSSSFPESSIRLGFRHQSFSKIMIAFLSPGIALRYTLFTPLIFSSSLVFPLKYSPSEGLIQFRRNLSTAYRYSLQSASMTSRINLQLSACLYINGDSM